MDHDADLLVEFVAEATEHLADVEHKLLSLEAAGDTNIEVVNSVFRSVHSIKGAAGFLGLNTIDKLAHGLEEVLNRMRHHELKVNADVTETALKAIDALKSLIDELERSNEMDVTEHVTALKNILEGRSSRGQSAETGASATASQPVSAPTVESSANEALREFLVESYEACECIERDLVAMEKQSQNESTVNGIFRCVHTIKGSAGFLGFAQLERLSHAAEDLLALARAGQRDLDSEVVGALLTFNDAVRQTLKEIETTGSDSAAQHEGLIQTLRQLKDGGTSPVQTTLETPTAPAAASPATPSPAAKTTAPKAEAATPQSTAETKPAPAKEGQPAEGAQASVSETSVRVDVALLDKLMNRVGELVLARNQILQYTAKLNDSSFQGTSQRLNLIATEIQESVMKTRMQPIGSVWSRFPRVVRDLALQLGKQVRIEMIGKETDLDRTIIEAIKDPLTHLVRNSVDHGIERPEARTAAGKPAEGCLLLRAFHEGGQVNIEISDDGAGLRLDRIRDRAIERGILTPERAARMSDKELGQLIFAPGFSTAEVVTNVSGRGVGMDVVRTNIEKIGGSIDLQSTPGQGTTIKIKIPLTLAIIPALLVKNDGDRYAIPQASLLELVRLEGDDIKTKIEKLHGAFVYRLRGRLLPLVSLRSMLSGSQLSTEEALATAAAANIVVLRADEREFGLIVDEINDTEEIVVKPLAKQLKGVAVYAGATIMGDGQVALILDMTGVGQQACIHAHTGQPGFDKHSTGALHSDSGVTQSLLLFETGDVRFALMMSAVTRLEKIDRSKVELSDGRHVVQYRNQIMPLIRLADIFGVQSHASEEHPLEVIVYMNGKEAIGLVVDQIVDIVQCKLSVTRKATRPGLLGSIVVQDHVTDLLDLDSVSQQLQAC